MIVRLHKNATTTPAIRAEIQAAPASVSSNSLAVKYGRNVGTINRWRRRTTVEDASHRPKQIKATLSPEMEEVVVELRRMLLLSIDDLLVVVREFICPALSRSALDPHAAPLRRLQAARSAPPGRAQGAQAVQEL
jgi:hypothetical protein